MTETITEIAAIELPYRRKATLRRVEFESGMKMIRLVLKEGTRITQVDLDADTARTLGTMLSDAADEA